MNILLVDITDKYLLRQVPGNHLRNYAIRVKDLIKLGKIRKEVELLECRETDLQLICCPIGRPRTAVGAGSSNLNFATLWLNCVRFTSLNSLKFSGSR